MMNRRYILLLLLQFYFFGQGIAQYESPVAYMNYLSAIESDLAADYMSYMSAMAHTNSARKMERRRAEVIATVKEGRQKVAHLKAYEGETTLREAYNKYLSILQAVLSEDYSKIVNMEEIAEQSYDKMEAYLLAQEKATEKLHAASDTLQSSYRQFAERNNVKLVESQSKISKKLEQTGTVMSYYNQIYLIHFKAFKQEAYTIDALNKGDVNGIEQNKSTLITYAAEGLEKLKTIKPLENDYSLVIACRQLLEFEKAEAETKISGLTDFLIAKDEFARFKKTYDGKPPQQRTKSDVDSYNVYVAAMNKTGDTYNKTNEELNSRRASLSNSWNVAVDRFLDVHVPKSR